MPGVNDRHSRAYKIAVKICRYANGGCLCDETNKLLCAGPKTLALEIVALPSDRQLNKLKLPKKSPLMGHNKPPPGGKASG